MLKLKRHDVMVKMPEPSAVAYAIMQSGIAVPASTDNRYLPVAIKNIYLNRPVFS